MAERKYWLVETTTDQLSTASVHIQPHIQVFACAFVRINLLKKDQTVLNHLDSLPLRKRTESVSVCDKTHKAWDWKWLSCSVCLSLCVFWAREGLLQLMNDSRGFIHLFIHFFILPLWFRPQVLDQTSKGQREEYSDCLTSSHIH